jgi:hypothetical protein
VISTDMTRAPYKSLEATLATLSHRSITTIRADSAQDGKSTERIQSESEQIGSFARSFVALVVSSARLWRLRGTEAG